MKKKYENKQQISYRSESIETNSYKKLRIATS